MKFNIARQPLPLAFLTLVALALVAMCCGGTPDGVGAEAGPLVPVLGQVIAGFQASHPFWTRLTGGFLLLFTGLVVGRISIRYKLYTSNSFLPLPLYGMAVCGVALGANYLVGLTASALLALALKNGCRACRTDYGFDAVFRCGLYLGVLPLVSAPTLSLWLMLPLTLLIFRRTLREAAVAVIGLMLPLLVACYLTWGFGGGFLDPLTTLWQGLVVGEPFSFVWAFSLPKLLLFITLLLLDLLAVILLISNRPTGGNKPRTILLFATGSLVIALLGLLLPSASPESIALVAAPSALVLPLLFLRSHPIIGLLLYLLWLTATFALLFLQ